jgi:hypothetical protein
MSSITPDTKKKKIALPSVLSNIRNAVGRAGVDEKGGKNEVEIRPLINVPGLNNRSSGDLVGVGKKSSNVNDRSQMRDRSTVPSSSSSSYGVPPPPLSATSPGYGLGQSRQTLPSRNAPSASSTNWSATLQTYSERIGSQWRKRNRRDSNERRRHRGVTINTQPILIVLGLFFIGFPILFMLFLLARKAVFGDEGVDNVAKHEVPAHEVLNNGADTGLSTTILGGENAESTWNDMKQLTSEDNPLGFGENDEGSIYKKEGGVNEAVINEVDANEADVVTNEAIGVALESETVDNTPHLRGSMDESSPAAGQQDFPADNGGVINSSGIENDGQSVPVLPPEEKTVDSTAKKEVLDEVSMADEQVVNGDSTVVDIVAEEDEKMTNSEEVIGDALIKDAGD